MTTYTKSLSGDFSGNIKCGQFNKEIQSGITGVTLNGVTLSGDTVDIVFSSPLSAGEQTTLNTIISNHVPDNNPPKNTSFTYTPRTTYSSNTVYQRVGGPFKYEGSDNIGTINYIEVVSYKDSLPTSYSVRIYDNTNSLVLAELGGLTNTDEQIIDLGTISNVPTGPSLLEVQVKQVGGVGANIHVEQVLIYYNN